MSDIVRGPKAVHAAKGSERETFIREVAKVLNKQSGEIDINLDLNKDYSCDELDVLECIQVAEDVWNVTIIPSPYTSDISKQIYKFKTLASIIEAAKVK